MHAKSVHFKLARLFETFKVDLQVKCPILTPAPSETSAASLARCLLSYKLERQLKWKGYLYISNF